MLVSRYSKPEFNPYENDDLVLETPDGPWRAPRAEGPLSATLNVPGSKSLTNRELILSALAEGPSVLKSPLHSRDTELMAEALRELGVVIDEIPGDGLFGPDWRVTPNELTGGSTIDCGLAGTVMRFVPPVAALALGPVAFDGDPHARKRPMRAVITALRDLGVDVTDDGRGALPFSLYGVGEVSGGELDIDASESSQFVSALLLSAARFRNGLKLRHTGTALPSLPHIEMTIATLRARGVEVVSEASGVWTVAAGPIAGRDVDIEPDLSNAAPFLAAALIAGGEVTVEGWPKETTQVGAQLGTLFGMFGASGRLEGSAFTVDGGAGALGGGSLAGVDVDLSDCGELAPSMVAVAALADSPSRIVGIGHLRGHETDRLAALSAELNALGGAVTVLDDGLAIDPRPLHGGLWHTYGDHRMATAGAILGLAVDDLDIEDIATTAKTLPEFPNLWRNLVHPRAVSNSDPFSLGLP
ncbi:MAG: 3-phosphoshikimate 1-carboxyvinyltransferase [Cryobacterium sp.]|jgi:3-phosphoshikimate 1-carboxyvinyltransferase|nr:3-phosphoshikimate 1-carboxyvinyltransferase [Cryobacterium sp.]